MKISTEETIKYRLKEMQQLLKTKELELLQETGFFFNHQKEQMSITFGKDSKLSQDLTERIPEYKQLQEEQFFKLLEKDLIPFTSKINYETLIVM